MVAGLKQNETRAWSTPYRGRLAIHATADMPDVAVRLCTEEPHFSAALVEMGYSRNYDDRDRPCALLLPRGAIVGFVTLVRCYRMDPLGRNLFSDREQAFGDYSPGRWVWEFRSPERLEEPIKARGARSLWEWEVPDALRDRTPV